MRFGFPSASKIIVGSMLVTLFALGGVAFAEEADPLHVGLDQYVVVFSEDNGDEQLVPLSADEMMPSGTVIEYAVTVRNAGSEFIDDIVLGLVVPIGTMYVETGETLDESVALLQFSIDGGATYRTPPVIYMEEGEGGVSVRRTATPDMFTHLRLVFLRAIRPEEELMFRYRVQVI